MKIVLDTNVLIAALIARGVCYELLEHCVLRHALFTSDFILNETREKLTEKFGYAADLADEAVFHWSVYHYRLARRLALGILKFQQDRLLAWGQIFLLN